MIETTVTAPLPARAEPSAPKQDDAPVFSFASAVSALETKAARSLEVHGATPDKGVAIGDNGAQARQAPKNGHASTDRASAPTSQPASSATSDPSSPAINPQTAQTPIASAALTAQTQANTVTIAPQTAVAPVTAQSAAMTAKADAAAVRAVDLARASATKEAKAPTAAHKPEAPTQDFAKLLARRLDAGATQFEFRLDPPSLGRVEAHMKLTDDGENVLALKFDQQTTLDLFARDEAALRNTLTSSGFSFNGEDVVFELAEEESRGDFNTLAAVDPFYAAPWSSGAVDISI